MNFTGPAAVGLMPKSKISVGQPSVAQALGTSTTADVALHRRCAEDGVGLGAAVAELLQVLDRVQAGLAVGHGHVQAVLLALLVDRDALEDQVVPVVRRDRARLEDRVLMPYLATPPLMRLTRMRTQPAISMAPQKVISPSPWLKCRSPTPEAAAIHIDREEDARAARQVP